MYSAEDSPVPRQDPIIETIEVDRAFSRPGLACASHMLAVDVFSGCTFGCLFCPVRRRGQAQGTIRLKVNLPDLLERELARGPAPGQGPLQVLLNPSCDPFVPVAPAMTLVHETLRLLLEAGAHVHLRTRGSVPAGFAELLEAHAAQVHPAVILSSMDPDLASLYEPGAATPQQRLDAIRRLRGWGMAVSARIEPLLPFVSDTAGHLEDLVRHLRSAGVERATTSYLVLTPQILDQLEGRIPTAHAHLIRGSFRNQTWRQTGIRQMTKLLPERTRREGYQRLTSIARKADLAIQVCACQNPGLGTACLSPAVSSKPACERTGPGQLDLFDCA